MNTISKDLEKIIRNGLDIASVLGIEQLLIDSESMRGENKETSTNIIFDMSDVDMPVDAIGLGRTPTLKSRMALFEDPVLEYTTKTADGSEFIDNLIIKSGRSKTGFRCHSPSRTAKAPKRIRDPIGVSLSMKDDDITRLTKGITSMIAETIVVSIVDGRTSIIVNDKVGDEFVHELEGHVKVQDNEFPSNFSATYKSKTFRAIVTNYLKKDDNEVLPISITSRGIMIVTVLGINIYLFPER